jgi:hypothetical protein
MLDTYRPDILYLCEERCEDQWLFFEAKRDPITQNSGTHWSIRYFGYRLEVMTEILTQYFIACPPRKLNGKCWLLYSNLLS